MGALSAATETILAMSDQDISDRTRSCVESVVERGKFDFIDKETFGEYMQVLQRANQAIFADQKRLLQRIKDIKKAAKATQVATVDSNTAAPENAMGEEALPDAKEGSSAPEASIVKGASTEVKLGS